MREFHIVLGLSWVDGYTGRAYQSGIQLILRVMDLRPCPFRRVVVKPALVVANSARTSSVEAGGIGKVCFQDWLHQRSQADASGARPKLPNAQGSVDSSHA